MQIIFHGCKSLSDITVLNSQNFPWMINRCKLLSNINDLKNWDVWNVYNFKYIFSGFKSLIDINRIKNWNISNTKNFTCIFITAHHYQI